MIDEDALDPTSPLPTPLAGSAPAAPEPTTGSIPSVVGARQLIGTSFELLTRSGEVMRRASFYIGLIILGTGGPLALALWGSLLAGFDPVRVALPGSTAAAASLWLLLLFAVVAAGIVVGVIEGTAVAIALLGGAFSGRPLTIRQAVQRSRMVFWSLVVATLMVSIPTAIVREAIGQTTEVGLIVGLIVGTLIQWPFVYAAAGIVLGGVGPLEALRRSIRIVRARVVAALILAILPSVYGLLVILGLEAGIDVAARAMAALGLGIDSGPFGVALITVLIVMVTFALGTLLFTVTAIVYAPQVVMFVGLTRATIGLDRVRPGGDHDPEHHRADGHRFSWLTRPMVAGFALGGLGLAGFLATIGS